MTRCTRCNRPMKHPTETGLGPVCLAKLGKPTEVERDLFGYNIARASEAARERVRVHVYAAAADARDAVRRGFADARRALGVA